VAARLLGFQVRIQPKSSDVCLLLSVVCCQVQFSARGRSLAQRSPTGYVCVWVWSRNPNNETYPLGLSCHKKLQWSVSYLR